MYEPIQPLSLSVHLLVHSFESKAVRWTQIRVASPSVKTSSSLLSWVKTSSTSSLDLKIEFKSSSIRLEELSEN